MPQAISAMLRMHGGLYDKQARRNRRAIGTPGAPNRPLTDVHRSEQREEQVNSDRLPPRRGNHLVLVGAPRCAEPQPRHAANLLGNERLSMKPSQQGLFRTGTSPWKALDQALRATDLLLQGGGFSTIVLDLGSVPPEAAWRIPLATWFRFRAACERTRVSLLLLTQHPCARSSAATVVRLQPGSMEARSKVMTAIRYQGATERSRVYESESRIVPIRKPPQPERMGKEPTGQWTTEAAWMQAG
jgi:recombination protein RecA